MELQDGLSLVTTAAVIIGVVFAAYEIRLGRLQRARDAELLLARSYQTPEFMRALDLVVALPEDLTMERLEARGPEVTTAVGYWLGAMESIGVLVHSGEIGLRLVEDFFSGPIVVSWMRLRPVVEERRRVLQRDTMHEWFQWLAERIQERESKSAPVPANIEYGTPRGKPPTEPGAGAA